MGESSHECKYSSLLRDVGRLLGEEIHHHKQLLASLGNRPERQHLTGLLLGLNLACRLIAQQAAAFGITLEEVGLQETNLNPEHCLSTGREEE